MSMKTNELRIGNYVKGIGHKISWLVEGVEPEYIYSSKAWRTINSFEGIPLTEEWLLKFGVQPNKWFCENSFCIVEDKTGDTHYGWCMKVQNASHTKEIEFACFKYVHQLQNLYYAITGCELTIKSE